MITDNNYVSDHASEDTILQSSQTSFRIEAWLEDTDYVQTQHRDGDYRLSFHTCSYHDHQVVAEQIEQAISTVRLKSPPWSRKEARSGAEDRLGAFLCSQLFAPKINVEFRHPTELIGKQVSLALHLREDPLGVVYLQCDYIDCFEPVDYPVVAPASEEIDPDDW
jgi:hypothetical protein